MEFTGIAFCPCCCSSVDVQVEDETMATLDCGACQQSWTMRVEASRFNEFSIH